MNAPSHLAHDLLTTSFLGFWGKKGGPSVGGAQPAQPAERLQHVYPTLVHWFEAAKFMPHRPDLRDAVLLRASSEEARKFSKRHLKEWRNDWTMVRYSVMTAGLAILALQRPELGLRSAPLAELASGLEKMKVPASFSADCLKKFELWRTAPRIAVLGAEVAPDNVVGTRMAKLVSPLPTWTLLSTCHRRTAWRLHDWALYHFVPIEYHGTPGDRSSRGLAESMIDACDQVVVFEQRRAKRFDVAIAHAKAKRKRITLELYDAEAAAAAAAQMTIT